MFEIISIDYKSATTKTVKAAYNRLVLLTHPDIRFFVEKNPGHVLGDELACIGRMGPGLWTSYMSKLGRRVLSGAGRGVRKLWASS